MDTPTLLNEIWKRAKAEAISPSDISDEFDTVNTRYAREVIGLMTQHGLLMEMDDTGGYVAIEDVNAKEVQAVIAKLAVPGEKSATPTAGKTVTVKAAPAKAKPGVKDCTCGCGEKVAGKSFYRPGHDARHAGNVAREVAASVKIEKGKTPKIPSDHNAYATLPSPALRDKARNMAGRIVQREFKKAAK